MSKPLTDPRLQYLLEGGKAVLTQADPEGITSGGRIRALLITKQYDSAAWKWALTVLSKDETGLLLSGIYDNKAFTVQSVRTNAERDGWKDLPVNASESLAGALGPLDRLPVQVKRILSSTAAETPTKAKAKPFSPERYYKMAVDALFWDVEGGEDGEMRERFRSVKVDYESEHNTVLSTKYKLEEGNISVRCNIDPFGLSQKKVTLTKSLGLGREVRSAACIHAVNKKDKPSVTVAFDLYGSIPTIYTKKRREREGLGVPMSK